MLNGWFSSNDTICADNYIYFRFKLQACVAVRSGSCICTAGAVLGQCLRLTSVVSATVRHPTLIRSTPSSS